MDLQENIRGEKHLNRKVKQAKWFSLLGRTDDDMNRGLQQKLKEQAGFTRLQQLMILVLAAVLVTVGSYTFTGYRRAAYQVKADRTAERFFDMAEKYIAIEKSSGRLQEWNERAAAYGGQVSMDDQLECIASRYQGADREQFLETYRKKYRRVPVYYICLESEAVGEGKREKNPILDIFAYQMVDENITKHTFLVEYNGNTGEVLSVLYSEKTDSFTYDGNREDKSNVMLRDKDSLNQKWQGYCGVDLEEM